MNKISRRNFLKVAGAGAAAMGLAACGGSSSSSSSVAASSTAANAAADTLSGTIEYWSSWSETENQALVLKQAADAFTQLHPNVKINFTFNGRDNRNLVVSAIEAGTQIDLMDANIDNVQKLWSENIKDLSSYIDKTYDTTNGKAYKDVVIPSMISLAGSLFDGKTMCIPYIPQAFMIFCNKGLLEECGVTEYPQTWEELMDACEKVKAAGHIPVTTDSNYCTSWVGYYMSRRLGNDRVMELAKDSSQWASEQGIKDTAEAIAYMAEKGYFDPNIESNVYPAAQQDTLFDNDSFCLAGLRSKTIGIYEKNSERKIICDISEYPYTLLWSAPTKPMRFICIEPWQSLPAAETDTSEWNEHAAAACIAPNESYSITLHTTFER